MLKRLDEFLDYEIVSVSDGALTVGSLLLILTILVSTLWLSKMARRATRRAFETAGVEDRDSIRISAQLVATAIWFIGLSAALHQSGFNPTAVFAAGGFAAVAVGFATQDLIRNYVSGASLRLEGAIHNGDILEVAGRMVRVVKMRARATIARDRDEQELIIPNAELAQTTVVNFTLRDKLYRLRTTVGVHYASDMAQARAVLEETAGAVPWRFSGQQPVVLLAQFGTSSVDWEVSVWISDPWKRRHRRSDLNEAIWNALQQMGSTE